MKNLPEQDFWDAIRNRLLQYKEEPDDDWHRIAAAIPSSDRDHRGFSKASDVTALVLLAFLSGFVLGDFQINKNIAEKVAGKIVLPKIKLPPKAESHTNTEQKATAVNTEEQSHNRTVVTNERVAVVIPEREKSTAVAAKVKSVARIQNKAGDKDDKPALVGNIETVEPAQDVELSGFGNTAGRKEETEDDKSDKDETVLIKKDSTVEIRGVASPVPKESKQAKKKFRPSVYFVASPTLGFFKVIPVRDDQIEVRSLERNGIFSSNRLGLHLEAGFQSQIGRNLELYASASYYQNEQTISYTFSDPTVLNVAAASDELSYTLSPGESVATITFRQKNIGAGLGLMYHIHGRRLMHKVGGGLQLVQGLISYKDDEGNTLPASRLLNYNLFYRLEYSIQPRASVFLQPSFTHAMSSNKTLNAPFDVKPYHAGLGLGLLFHF